MRLDRSGQGGFTKGASLAWSRGVSLVVWSMALILAAQVICRYVLDASLVWGEEAARFLLIAITFVASQELVKARGLTAFDLKVRSPARNPLQRFIQRLPEAVFFAVFIFSAWSLTARTMGQKSIALGVPMHFVYASMIVFGAGGLISAFLYVIRPPKDR